jgi:NMD protein affecting ribosome stability and mRNA decay
MPLTKCPRCKRLFERIHSAVCQRCQADEDADFDKIRAVLDRLPNLNMEEVSTEANVPIECVMRMLDEGLITNVSLNQDVKCGRCGAPAISQSKKLCQACLDKLNAEVAAAQGRIKLDQKKPMQIGEHLHASRAFEDKKI